MEQLITRIEQDSIASELGIRPGDRLAALNGEPICDVVDYKALEAEEYLTIDVRRGKQLLSFDIEKDSDEPLGLIFETALMSPMRCCANRCVFCFVDQLPAHTRDTMHVKDDDWRMSFIIGNFVTLTNVGDRELDRIIRRGASPLYISVHALDPEVRCRLLGNPTAGRIGDQLRRLADGGIRFHTQIVLCPGINDGDVLARTIDGLAALYPACVDCAVVPVGLTGHRGGLTELRAVDAVCAREVIETVRVQAGRCSARFGTDFVYAADEFYTKVRCAPPSLERYGELEQLDNGVGMLALMESEVSGGLERLARADYDKNRRIALATGVSAYPFICNWVERIRARFPGVEAQVFRVENTFFGPSVTVSGLVTGGDIARTVMGRFDELLIPRNMLRPGTEIFLDDTDVTWVENKLGMPIRVTDTYGGDFVAAVLGVREEI
ncbi:MAG: DUF512 domain-containing protein [Eubacteriales bacterium]|nr:DUF512 domain-containing protein [Eubacteriales bacterium]